MFLFRIVGNVISMQDFWEPRKPIHIFLGYQLARISTNISDRWLQSRTRKLQLVCAQTDYVKCTKFDEEARVEIRALIGNYFEVAAINETKPKFSSCSLDALLFSRKIAIKNAIKTKKTFQLRLAKKISCNKLLVRVSQTLQRVFRIP